MSFETELKGFAESIMAMHVAATAVNTGTEIQTEGIKLRIRDFIDTKGIKSHDQDGKITFSLNPQDIEDFENLDRIHKRLNISRRVLPKSFVVTIVSNFDAHIGRVIKLILETKPEILNASEKTLKFSDVWVSQDIETLRNAIIEKEIESILRNSHEEHFIYLENKLKTNLRNLETWKDFIEITERRNLFVHTDGVVSTQYIQKCTSAGISIKGDVKQGIKLDCDLKYVKHSVKVIFEMGVKLCYVVWRKLLPDESDKADEVYLDICYQLVRENSVPDRLNETLSRSQKNMKQGGLWKCELNQSRPDKC